MSETYERRAMIECRAEPIDNGRRIRGYAVVFNQQSLPIKTPSGMTFREMVAPSAVDRTLREGIDVRALVNHTHGQILGRRSAGTLELSKDAHGLRIVIEPDPGISYVGDVMRSMMRGDVTGMSFAFSTLDDDWERGSDMPLRTLVDTRISEISIVTFPAYEQADVSIAQRSYEMFASMSPQRSLKHLERIQRQHQL
jgi:HK97 family phage prohead protease